MTIENLDLFNQLSANNEPGLSIIDNRKQTEKLARIDTNEELYNKLLPYCRLKPGEIHEDPQSGHRVGVMYISV